MSADSPDEVDLGSYCCSCGVPVDPDNPLTTRSSFGHYVCHLPECLRSEVLFLAEAVEKSGRQNRAMRAQIEEMRHG